MRVSRQKLTTLGNRIEKQYITSVLPVGKDCSSKQLPGGSASAKDLVREVWIPRFFVQILTPISNLFQGGAPFGRRANIWGNSWRERKDRLRKAAQRFRESSVPRISV
jgi:hypothetical protein